MKMITLWFKTDLKFALCQLLSLRGSSEEGPAGVAGHAPVVDTWLLHPHVAHGAPTSCHHHCIYTSIVNMWTALLPFCPFKVWKHQNWLFFSSNHVWPLLTAQAIMGHWSPWGAHTHWGDNPRFWGRLPVSLFKRLEDQLVLPCTTCGVWGHTEKPAERQYITE